VIVAILQARVGSARLPGKVLADLAGQPMLLRQAERIAASHRIDRLVVATSTSPQDDPLAILCAKAGIACHRGALDDVLDRVHAAAKAQAADWVVRLTGDCPLIDPAVIDLVIETATNSGADYVTNAVEPTWPDGLDVEVARIEALDAAWREATLPSEREHVMPFIRNRPDRFRIVHVRQDEDLSDLRWTVDEPEDLEFVRAVYARLYPANPAFTTRDILDLLERDPSLSLVNASFARNEGYAKSLEKDKSA